MTTTPTTATRARRTARPSGDDRQRAIVDTVERLLGHRSLSDLGVDEIAAGAAISRSAFYFYFPSKQAVLLELLERMVAEVDERLAAVAPVGDDPVAWWRSVLGVFVDVFSTHRAVTATIAEAQATVPEVRDEWARRSARWVDAAAATIVAERRRGRAREIVDPVATSIALNAMNERVITAAVRGESPALAPDQLLDVLADVWCATVYGAPHP